MKRKKRGRKRKGRSEIDRRKGLALRSAEDRPSEATDDYYIRAQRKKGRYKKPTRRSGKWLVFVKEDDVDAVWAKIREAVEEGRLGGSAKVSTAKPNPLGKPGTRVVCVYTYDSNDRQDVERIREELRKLGITDKIPYKTDEDTMAGRYAVFGDKRISKCYE